MSLLRTTRSRVRAGFSLAAAFLAVSALASPAANALIPIQDGGGGVVIPRPTTTTTRPATTVPTTPVTAWPGTFTSANPRYKVEAVSMKANDESGIDWLGSDEPMWIFNGSGADGVVRTATREFGDVDSGETRSFGNLCLVSNCVTGVEGPISLQVTLIESDLFGSDIAQYGTKAAGYINLVCPYTGSYKPYCMAAGTVLPYIASWLGDDLIQTTTVSWPVSDLAPMYVGQSVQESILLTDGDARYTFTFRTTRLA